MTKSFVPIEGGSKHDSNFLDRIAWIKLIRIWLERKPVGSTPWFNGSCLITSQLVQLDVSIHRTTTEWSKSTFAHDYLALFDWNLEMTSSIQLSIHWLQDSCFFPKSFIMRFGKLRVLEEPWEGLFPRWGAQGFFLFHFMYNAPY